MIPFVFFVGLLCTRRDAIRLMKETPDRNRACRWRSKIDATIRCGQCGNFLSQGTFLLLDQGRSCRNLSNPGRQRVLVVSRRPGSEEPHPTSHRHHLFDS